MLAADASLTLLAETMSAGKATLKSLQAYSLECLREKLEANPRPLHPSELWRALIDDILYSFQNNLDLSMDTDAMMRVVASRVSPGPYSDGQPHAGQHLLNNVTSMYHEVQDLHRESALLATLVPQIFAAGLPLEAPLNDGRSSWFQALAQGPAGSVVGDWARAHQLHQDMLGGVPRGVDPATRPRL